MPLDPPGRWLLVVWGAMLGGILGSFLNVVVYRLPRGMSLSRPGSRCPVCQHPIRWHDNVPVLGWFVLRGRCRDCATRISARYPVVEAVVAAVGALVMYQAIEELPPRNGDLETGYVVDFAIVVHRLLLACTVIAAALIEYDGFLPPRRLIVVSVVLGLGLLFVWPQAIPPSLFHNGYGGFRGIAAALLGVFVALLIGAGPGFTFFMNAHQRRLAYAVTAVAELMLVGAFVGDRGVAIIGLESMALYLITQWLALRWPAVGLFGWSGPLALVTLLWLIVGSHQAPSDPWLFEHQGHALLFAVVSMILMALLLQVVPPVRRELRQDSA